MKIVNLVVALLFAMSLCLASGPVDSFAKAETKETATTKKVDKSKGKKTAKSKAKATGTKKGKTAKKESAKKKTVAKKTELKPKSVSVNSADKTVLAQLPGVGEKTADAILKYRKANGKFKSIDDLKNVKGIGDKKLSAMKKYLKL